jgi:hypothetical protein
MSADTPRNVDERYARLIMARTPQERVVMCFEMSATARAIVRQSLEAAGLAGEDVGPALVTRLYGADLSPTALQACREIQRQKMGSSVPLAVSPTA